MSSDASSSHPPPLVARAETTLAPGFRFHPTDEELVMYYLKRKILSKPFRVDAISEIDLYKEDPWDLPGKSRIQSRDMEWYFFSPLDRKYSNRSRTNRATATGYWKTTGKDRAVKRGERALGMKKTLVFHVGRAPKGERTNWVMHEYRIDDKELLSTGFSPDEYVVCRIFQKSGSGPQNGAQYGAPFIEEEWENDDYTMMLPDVDISVEEPLLALGAQQLTEREDFEQEIKDVTILKENDGPLALPKRQDNFDNPDVNEETFENESFNAYKQNIGLREVHSRESFGIAEDYAPQVSDENCIPEDGYLELNDFVDSLDVVNASSQDPINELAWIRNDQAFATLGQFATLPELHGVEEFFDFTNENANLQEDTLAPFENKFYFGINGMLDVMGDCPIAERADDEVVYHDVYDTNQLDKNDDFLEMNDFLHPVLPESCLSDPVDELIAYLNDTEEGMQNSDLGNSERSDPSLSIQVHNDSEVVGDCSDPHVFIASSKNGSSVEISAARGKCCDDICEADDYLAVKDVKSGKEWEKTITGRLIGMLGSIHSPPAQAAEHPMKGASTSDPSSSMQITAGIVQINGFIMGRRNDWSAQKNDVGFILSYGMVRNDFNSNMEKMHGGAISLMIRNGFCLSLLSVLFLALTFKLVGVCIYGR